MANPLPGTVRSRFHDLAGHQARHQMQRFGATGDQRPDHLAARTDSDCSPGSAALLAGVECHGDIDIPMLRGLLRKVGGGHHGGRQQQRDEQE